MNDSDAIEMSFNESYANEGFLRNSTASFEPNSAAADNPSDISGYFCHRVMNYSRHLISHHSPYIARVYIFRI
jgi:hypothetical protein